MISIRVEEPKKTTEWGVYCTTRHMKIYVNLLHAGLRGCNKWKLSKMTEWSWCLGDGKIDAGHAKHVTRCNCLVDRNTVAMTSLVAQNFSCIWTFSQQSTTSRSKTKRVTGRRGHEHAIQPWLKYHYKLTRTQSNVAQRLVKRVLRPLARVSRNKEMLTLQRPSWPFSVA